jgi:isopenicillin N synthase-like dioxygenase
MGAVQVVDIAPWTALGVATGAIAEESRARAVAAISHSLSVSGLCLITGHGVSAELRQQVHQAALDFFKQPQSVKQRFSSKQRGTPGYMREGQQHLGQTLSSEALPPDMNEFLVFSTGSEGHPEAKASRTDAAELAVVPNVPPQLPALFTEYSAAMDRLNSALMQITATALGQSPDFFTPFFTPGVATLQSKPHCTANRVSLTYRAIVRGCSLP